MHFRWQICSRGAEEKKEMNCREKIYNLSWLLPQVDPHYPGTIYICKDALSLLCYVTIH